MLLEKYDVLVSGDIYVISRARPHWDSWSVYLAICVAWELDGDGGAEASGGAALSSLRKCAHHWGSSEMA